MESVANGQRIISRNLQSLTESYLEWNVVRRVQLEVSVSERILFSRQSVGCVEARETAGNDDPSPGHCRYRKVD